MKRILPFYDLFMQVLCSVVPESRLPCWIAMVWVIRNVSFSHRQRWRRTAQKWSFPLRISSVNVTKSAVSCGFGHIYWANPLWETSFFVQCHVLVTSVKVKEFESSQEAISNSGFLFKKRNQEIRVERLKERVISYWILPQHLNTRTNMLFETSGPLTRIAGTIKVWTPYEWVP